MFATQKKAAKQAEDKKLYEAQIENWPEDGKPYEQGLRLIFTRAARQADEDSMAAARIVLAVLDEISRCNDFIGNPPPERPAYWPWKAAVPDAAEQSAIVERAKNYAQQDVQRLGLSAFLELQKEYLAQEARTVATSRGGEAQIPARFVNERTVARSLTDGAQLKEERAAAHKDDLKRAGKFMGAFFLIWLGVMGSLFSMQQEESHTGTVGDGVCQDQSVFKGMTKAPMPR